MTYNWELDILEALVIMLYSREITMGEIATATGIKAKVLQDIIENRHKLTPSQEKKLSKFIKDYK